MYHLQYAIVRPPKGGFGSQTAPPFAPPTAPRTCGGRESRHRGLIGRAAALDGAQRPFLRVPGAFRVFYGPQDRPGSTISGLRGVRVGWRPGRAAGSAAITRARRGAPSSSPLREADDHEAGTLARDGPVDAAPSGARERLRGRPPGWRGWLPPPFDPPENARADARKIAGYGFAAMAVSPGSCGRWAVLPVDHIVPSSAGFAFSASVAKD